MPMDLTGDSEIVYHKANVTTSKFIAICFVRRVTGTFVLLWYGDVIHKYLSHIL